MFLLNKTKSVPRPVHIVDDGTYPTIYTPDFVNVNGYPLDSVVVHVGRYRYLVIGYHDPALPVNQALQLVRNRIRWQGEVAVVSLGQYTPVLSKPAGPKSVLRCAVGR